MNGRQMATILAAIAVISFAFFAPVAHTTGFPVFCRVITHSTCMGGVVPTPGFLGSLSFWLFGYGGTYYQGTYQVVA
jgi:hypothetical protein